MKLERSNNLLQRQQNANDQVVFEYEERRVHWGKTPLWMSDETWEQEDLLMRC